MSARPIAPFLPAADSDGGIPALDDDLRSIDEIEAATGLDFFRDLNDTVEDALEKDAAGAVW